MRKLCLTIFIILSLILPQQVLAIYDPLRFDNNKFGIHIHNESDLADAANLVNSSGGQWGYVTVVIPENDHDTKKWQAAFDQMRRLHLIPIVRIATVAQKGMWTIPEKEEIDSWVSFLNSLNWVIKNRYVILFNEPNHDKEWGGKSDAAEYVSIVNSFREKLKSASEDFFVMPAGMDLAAGNTKDTTSAETFFKQMYEADDQIFKKFDGWTSHSYPNPSFSGDPQDSGKATIRGFEWELDYLSDFGLAKDIPVFITETGWTRQSDDKKVADYYKYSFENVWNTKQVVAVTPFIINYLDPPFDKFSWRDATIRDRVEFLPQYAVIQELKKTKGSPVQIHDYKFEEAPLPPQLIINSNYIITPQMINSGQSIWQPGDVTARIKSNADETVVNIKDIPAAEPYKSFELPINIVTPNKTGILDLEIEFLYKGVSLGEKLVRQIELVEPKDIQINTWLGWKRSANAHNVKVVIYEGDKLSQEITDLDLQNGTIKLSDVHDLIPGRTYRFVIVAKGYLPKASVSYLEPNDQTIVKFGRIWPFDFNHDGKFSVADLGFAITHVGQTLKSLAP